MRARAAVLAIIVIAAACTGSKDAGPGPERTSAAPGNCTGIDVASSPEKVTLLEEVAQVFNDWRVESNGKCLFVRVQKKSSGTAEQALAAGWDAARDGPLPHI